MTEIIPAFLIFLIVLGLAVACKVIWDKFFQKVTVYEFERGIKYVNGKLTEILAPGAYWIRPTNTFVSKLDMRPRFLVVAGQEVLTADSVSLKLSIAAECKVVDAKLATLSTENYHSTMYTHLQMSLREIVGGAKVDDLLQGRSTVSEKLMSDCAPKATAIGLELISADIKDIMFSGEMKKVFTQVVKAQKEGQAALERARGESAALRNLANSAKILEDNPALLQLRALQTLSESTGNTLVFGVPGALPFGPGKPGAPRPAPPPPPAE